MNLGCEEEGKLGGFRMKIKNKKNFFFFHFLTVSENVFEYVELLLGILKFVGFIFPPNVIQRQMSHICC